MLYLWTQWANLDEIWREESKKPFGETCQTDIVFSRRSLMPKFAFQSCQKLPKTIKLCVFFLQFLATLKCKFCHQRATGEQNVSLTGLSCLAELEAKD